ncbi:MULTISPECIES: hypothetical protein [Paenibacillus]|uniref:Heat shock protein DnaJ n=1 Tax=Paenibacillus naphthalenovorans TaxID=162209 RepID=A0A0U2VD44_9BACL|nr:MULTISPECIES: hypothetical protein [Paenibacillus]ALS21459.1 heat shock protein DnaJ [Paenibacillus naphthalenovorans]SDI77789.1 hypothetical protein SAMN05421868_110147 [Paenibacillus naphthalenovorans]
MTKIKEWFVEWFIGKKPDTDKENMIICKACGGTGALDVFINCDECEGKGYTLMTRQQ